MKISLVSGNQNNNKDIGDIEARHPISVKRLSNENISRACIGEFILKIYYHLKRFAAKFVTRDFYKVALLSLT